MQFLTLIYIDPERLAELPAEEYDRLMRGCFEKADALRVPVGALFRRNGKWTVFVVDGGRLAARGVELGLRGARDAEVIAGLSDKEEVVLYPGNDLSDGARVQPRS